MNEYCKQVYGVLNNAVFPESTVVMMAYPNSDKPVRMKKPAIAVKPGGTSTESASLGDTLQYGTETVYADVFVPFSAGSERLCAVAEAAVKAVLVLTPLKVCASEPRENNALGCLFCRLSFGFCTCLDSELR